MNTSAAALSPAEPRPLSTDPASDAAPDAAPARPLRVLFTGYRSHPHVGGQGVYLFEVTRALADLGHEVHVASGPPYPDLDPRVRLHTFPALDLFTKDNAFAAFRPGFVTRWPDLAEWWLHNTGAFGEPYAFAARLRDWLADRAGGFDVIHDNQGLASPMLGAAEAAGAPLVATLHHPITVDLRHALDAEPSWINRMWLRRWHSFVRAQAKTARALPAIVTVSQAAREQTVADFGVNPDRVHVAHNGVDHTTFRPRADIERSTTQVVAAVSSDIALKGLPTLIAAFAELAGARPDVELLVIGRQGDATRDRIAAAGIADRVRFASGLTREEMAEAYARAAVVAAPSLFEGFGFPAAEAMACGAPVVASDGGALPEVVGDAGLIVPAGDAPALAAGLAALLDDPARARALGAAGAEAARRRFTWSEHARRILALYTRAGLC